MQWEWTWAVEIKNKAGVYSSSLTTRRSDLQSAGLPAFWKEKMEDKPVFLNVDRGPSYNNKENRNWKILTVASRSWYVQLTSAEASRDISGIRNSKCIHSMHFANTLPESWDRPHKCRRDSLPLPRPHCAGQLTGVCLSAQWTPRFNGL